MAMASNQLGIERKTVAVIGDGAMTAGMAFEAINHAAHVDKDFLVVLNDNQMSISQNVGGLSTYFSKLWASKFYNQIRESGKKALKSIPQTASFIKLTEEYMKGIISPATIFEELGFNYIGPIDGHNLPLLIQTLNNLKNLNGPVYYILLRIRAKALRRLKLIPLAIMP